METEYWAEVVDPAEEAVVARLAAVGAAAGVAAALAVVAGVEAFQEEVVVRVEEAVVSVLLVVAWARLAVALPEGLFSAHLADEDSMEAVDQACLAVDVVHWPLVWL